MIVHANMRPFSNGFSSFVTVEVSQTLRITGYCPRPPRQARCFTEGDQQHKGMQCMIIMHVFMV